MRRADVVPLNDPVGFVNHLRSSFRPDHLAVDALVPTEDIGFRTLTDHLSTALMPLPEDLAVLSGLAFDALLGAREPFDRPWMKADAAAHATRASSDARKGRLLAALVRFGRVRNAIEIGTAYGISAIYLARSLPDGGQLVSLEISEPQRTVSRRVVDRAELQNAHLIGRPSLEAVNEVIDIVGAAELLFHDGEHSRAAYINDFDAYAEILAPGSLVLFDDIRWADPWSGAPASETYAGWTAVTRHPRVAAAVELDTAYGLLLLS